MVNPSYVTNVTFRCDFIFLAPPAARPGGVPRQNSYHTALHAADVAAAADAKIMTDCLMQ